MAKASKFVLRIGDYERHELTLTPRDAARAATQIAKGTLDRSKSFHEQPSNAQPGRAVKLEDESGAVVMSCRPMLRKRDGKSYASRTFATCDVAPSFRSKIRRRRRKKR